MSANPSNIFLNQINGLFHPFGTPSIVNGTPNSLLKLFSLLRTKRKEESTVNIASLVDVLPTLPVTAIILGLYFLRTILASQVRISTTIFLNIDFTVYIVKRKP